MDYPLLSQADVSHKTVLLRAGFDVPIEHGKVIDTTRIEAMLPTIRYLLEKNAAVIIMAHQGRPKGERNLEYSQKPLVSVLQDFLGKEVQFSEYCTGDATMNMAHDLSSGEILLLENLRFDPREKSKDASERGAFGKELASLADVYVNDAFTNCHRDHASMTSVPKYIPSYLGLQVQQEIEALSRVTHDPVGPVTLIVSGAKIETKVPVIEQFLHHGNDILVGGCIANTLIAAQGNMVGSSRYDEEYLHLAQSLLEEAGSDSTATIHVPSDVVVASEPTENASTSHVPVDQVPSDMAIFDIGSGTMQEYCDVIAQSGTIVWNGPLGFAELEPFSGATKILSTAIKQATENGAISIVGGGDTLDFHERYSISLEGYTFVSMAGGAMLDFISGASLPALEILKQ